MDTPVDHLTTGSADVNLRRFRLRDLPALTRAHPTLTALLATIVLMEVAHGVELLALFPLYLSEVENESASLVALTISTYLVVDILMRTPAGWLADRIGRKPVLLAGVILSALPLPLMMQVRDPGLFLLLNAVNGLGAGCIWPSIYASIADRYGPGRRGLIFGLVNTVMLGGLATGPISGGLLLGGSGSFTFSFLFCFALIIVVAGIVLFGVQETRTEQLPASEATQATRVSLRVDAQMVLLFVVVFCLTMSVAILTPVLTFYGRDVLGLTPGQFALTLALPALATAVALVPFGRFADQHGRKRPLVVGLAIFGFCLWLSPISTSPPIVAFGATIGGLGYALAVPAWNALTMDRIPSDSRGTLLGVVAALQGIGLVIGPEVGGRLWDTVSHIAPFLASAAVLTIGALVALALKEE
ncbi:MAG: MFS transporter [Chloroflexi bacterium]|nr:MFS transporter [Chloroflexota bacterium]